jgi:hypothetical protein
MGKMEQFLRIFHKKPMRALESPTEPVEQQFNKGAIIVCCDHDERFMEMLNWTDLNSKGSVAVKLLKSMRKDDKWVSSDLGSTRVFFAFEKSDDALYFRIKYGNR